MENEKNENINSQNDETLEEETFNEDETLDETLDEETFEDEGDDNSEEDNSEELEELKKKNKELENKNKQLFERLKKTKKEPAKKTSGAISEEDLIRISKMASNLDDDDLEVLQSIKGESIADKLDNPMFKAYKKEKQAKQRSEASSLKPSKPGLQVQGKSFNDPNLTDEEHKAMFNKIVK